MEEVELDDCYSHKTSEGARRDTSTSSSAVEELSRTSDYGKQNEEKQIQDDPSLLPCISDTLCGVGVVCKDVCKDVSTRTLFDKVWSCDRDGQQKRILDNVNISVTPGTVTGILGPSGSGKTTLLNMIAQRSTFGKTYGQIYYNGNVQTPAEVKNYTNYVMAHDKLLCYLTVEETLTIAAKLKLPHATIREREFRVEQVLNDMGLHHCRKTYIGGEWKKGISTGEMKRVSIAIELLDSPLLLLLDEPTSGLDSSLALEVMQVLCGLARSGRSIVLTIHQPRSQVFAMVDKLILLNEGRVVFQGSPDSVKPYFGELGYPCPSDWNPADFVLDIISYRPNSVPATFARERKCSLKAHVRRDGEEIVTIDCGGRINLTKEQIEKLGDHYVNSPYAKAVEVEIHAALEHPQPCREVEFKKEDRVCGFVVWLKQLTALYQRFTYNSFRNPLVGFVAVLILALQGLVLGGIFFQLSKNVEHITPAPINYKWLESTYVRSYIYGVDGLGRHPLLDGITSGVDGKGSQPVWDFLHSPENLKMFRTFLECSYEKFNKTDGHPMNKYPDHIFPEPDVWPTGMPPDVKSSDRAIAGLSHAEGASATKVPFPTGNEAIGGAVTALQLMDHLYYVIMPLMGQCKYVTQLECIMKYLLSISECIPAGYAPSRRLEYNPNPLDGGIAGFIAEPLKPVYQTTMQIIERLATCGNALCNTFGSYRTFFNKLVSDSSTSLMIVLNIAGCLFFAVANLGFASYDALLTFPQERAVFNHETANGLYQVSAYFLAKNLADLPFQLIPSLTLATVYYWMVGLSATALQFFTYFGICASVIFAAYGFGYMVSAASPRMEISVLIAPLTLVIWLTLAGFFLRDGSIPVWIDWFKYLSFYRWGFFSLVSNQFPPGGHFGNLPNDVILALTGITDSRVWFTTSLIIALGLGFRVLCFIFLKFTNRKVGVER